MLKRVTRVRALFGFLRLQRHKLSYPRRSLRELFQLATREPSTATVN